MLTSADWELDEPTERKMFESHLNKKGYPSTHHFAARGKLQILPGNGLTVMTLLLVLLRLLNLLLVAIEILPVTRFFFFFFFYQPLSLNPDSNWLLHSLGITILHILYPCKVFLQNSPWRSQDPLMFWTWNFESLLEKILLLVVPFTTVIVTTVWQFLSPHQGLLSIQAKRKVIITPCAWNDFKIALKYPLPLFGFSYSMI